MNKSFVLITAFIANSAHAQSGADALLKSLGTSVTAPAAQQANSVAQSNIHLNNPMAVKLFGDWNSQKGLSYEINAWVQRFLADDFEGYAHLKTAMEPHLAKVESASFKNTLQAAHVYSLYRLNLPQTFLSEWLSNMDREAFATSEAANALDNALMAAQPMDQWLFNQKIQLSAAQEAVIKKVGLTRHVNWLALNAFLMQRKGLAAEETLSKLTLNSPFRPLLSMTVALGYARKGDISNAAKILKTHYEPWMNQSKDANAQSKYSLEIARLLYQVGSVDGAVQYYQKIPKGSADYITAREELSWCWLRQGNFSELRGNLATLTSSVMSDQFRPESSLVKAISDLKMCNYSDVEKDFQAFVKSNADWAKKIEANIQSPESALPRVIDDFSQYAMDAVRIQQEELKNLQGLEARSAQAAMPAVGTQKHWTQSITAMKVAMEAGKKRQADEFRRQWKHDKVILQEAIRKMQFVKVELLSQVSQTESLTKKASTTDEVKSAKAKIKEEGDHSFPFDGVVWPDELFKLKAVSDGQCSGKL